MKAPVATPPVMPIVMGIVNITPDSFSGDGLWRADYVARALDQATQMIEDGAGMLDIGGESSRPGATPVSAAEEMRRTIPVIEAIRKKFSDIPIAIDTIKAEVAAEALRAGADTLNDITALTGDNRMAAIAAQGKARVVLMHNRSAAQAVRREQKIGGVYEAPLYGDVTGDVARDLQTRIDAALTAGIARDKIILDPGIGFGKTAPQNLALIAHLDRVAALGFPILMGVSRKSFIGEILDTSVEERLEGTAACVTACVLNGASIIRVHDVKFMARIVTMATALRDA